MKLARGRAQVALLLSADARLHRIPKTFRHDAQVVARRANDLSLVRLLYPELLTVFVILVLQATIHKDAHIALAAQHVSNRCRAPGTASTLADARLFRSLAIKVPL